MTGDPRDLATLSVDALLNEYVRLVKHSEATEHIGHKNRLAKQEQRILSALKSRADGTLRLLLPLRTHPDPAVQLSSTILCKSLDPGTYREVVQRFAKGWGPLREQARNSLFLDKWLRERPHTPREPVERPPDHEWQTASDVPVGITRLELERRVSEAFPLDLAGRITGLAKPTIGLWPRRPRENADPLASRLGGMPMVPHSWDWPAFDDEPMHFIGQINCSELAPLRSARVFPASGLIAFFADHDFVNGCGGGWETEGGAVFFWPETRGLALAQEPIDDFQQLRSCGLAFYETYSVPDPFSKEIEALSLDRAQRDKYSELHQAVRVHGVAYRRFRDISTSKLLGWPDLIQKDFLPEFYAGGPVRLLLQVGDYDDGADYQNWGPGGLVYFAISEGDLAERRFDRVLFEMQCT